jgi:hypothetical protein
MIEDALATVAIVAMLVMAAATVTWIAQAIGALF